LSLFLDILGVGLRSPKRIDLRGESPFEGTVVVRWRGVEIRKDGADTRIVFPSGASAHVEGPEPVEVETIEGEAEGTRR
jgi:hypothetical protein